MGNKTLNFRPSITKEKLARLKKVTADMEVGQEISIILERTDAHQADQIIDILKENSFRHQTKGGHEDEFYIKAKKV